MNQTYQSPLHNVPFIPPGRIAKRASRLITEYFEKRGCLPSPPIPVELILQSELGFSISYGQLEEEIGPGVLGALLMEGKEVRFDASLCEHGREGRHNFTVSHEIGHLVLHANLLKQTDFLITSGTPSIVCRNKSTDPVEVQADKFAACLLMPEDMVREKWEEVLAAPWPLCLDEYESACRKRMPFAAGRLTIETWNPFFGASDLDTLYKTITGHLVPHFRVSKQAMRIRLENLGCFVRQSEQMALI